MTVDRLPENARQGSKSDPAGAAVGERARAARRPVALLGGAVALLALLTGS